MGKATNTAVTARSKARERLLAMNAERARRDQRIEDATVSVIDAAAKLAAVTTAAADERVAALAAYEATIAKIDAAAAAAVAAAEPAVTAGLADLAAEGLKPSEIATLTELPIGEVRRLSKPDSGRGGTGKAGGRKAGSAPSAKQATDEAGGKPVDSGGASDQPDGGVDLAGQAPAERVA